MPNLEVLSLSINKIASLKDFKNCKKLSELYMRKNEISDLSEIYYLKDMANLKILWLNENPCARDVHYRKKVLSVLQNLEKLDDQDVTDEEKQMALEYRLKSQIQDLSLNEVQRQENQAKKHDAPSREYPAPVQNPIDAAGCVRRSKWQRDSPVEVPFMRASAEAVNNVEDQLNDQAQIPSLLPDNLPEIDDDGNLVQPLGELQQQKPQYLPHPIPDRLSAPYQQHQSRMSNQRTNNNVLTAVLALIQELDQDSLMIVQAQISKLTPKY